MNRLLPTTCLGLTALALTVPASGQIGTETVATGLTFPIFAEQAAGDARLFVAQRAGQLRVIQNGTLQPGNFLNISGSVNAGGEGGLLGTAFAPDFATSGVLYLNYTSSTTTGSNSGLDTVIERVTLNNFTSNTPTVASRQTVLRLGQPFLNHNAGWIGFRAGEPNNLYIPTGDGGSSNDPGNRAQDLGGLYGKVLRIDVSGADAFPTDPNRNYAIPADNFFAADGNPGTRGEIIAYGLRNPYRNSFDRLTGDLYLGDVGQNAREEVSVLDAGVQGQNFGWRLREGTIATPTGGVGGPRPADNVDPIFDYAHGSSLVGGGAGSITGGYVYRGSQLPAEFQGLYFFGDFVAGRLFTIDPSASDVFGSVVDRTTQLFPGGFPGFQLVSFAEDNDGELYIIASGGTISRIVPEPSAVALLAGGALLGLRRRC